MTIVLLILRIIGLVLLAVLGLLVLFLLLFLFVPVRYRAQGVYDRQNPWSVRVKLSWLLHAVTLTAELREDERDIGLRIFGIRKKMEKTYEASDRGEDTEKADSPEQSEPDSEREPADGAGTAPGRGEVRDLRSASELEKGADSGTDNLRTSGEERKRKSPFGKIADRLGTIKQKLAEVWKRLRLAVKNFADTAGKIQNLLTDERNHTAVRFLGGKVFFLLRKLLPKKLSLKLQFSMGAPDTTGELLGVLAMFPFGYQNRWNVTPDFASDEAYAETEFEVLGQIRMFRLAGVIISILKNKDCRYLYKKLKTIF